MAKHFRWLVLLSCCAYLGLQSRYIAGLPLVMDEFGNAGHVFHLTRGLPYRDYEPYKTVLGYYALLPVLIAVQDTWTALLAVKLEIACLTSAVLALVALRLRRHFDPLAIGLALLLLCTQSTFLERASELRVDMLASLLGLVSLIAHLERRSLLAGAAAAAAVLVTQKGAYFVLALAGSLLFQVAYCRARPRWREALATGAAAAGLFFAYIAFWCVVGEPRSLWHSMFVQPRGIAFESLYAIDRYWSQTLERNPIFYGIAAAGLLLLIPHWRRRADTVQGRLWAYSAVLLGLCAWHKQPWPYFFVLLIPTAWVLGAAALDRNLRHARWWTWGMSALALGGALASAVSRIPVALARSSLAQRETVRAASAFLRPGESYLAGMEMVWRQPHVAELVWLDEPRLKGLALAPQAALDELRSSPPRLVIDNPRVRSLPLSLLTQLDQAFWPVGGNLFCYAPRLVDGESIDFAYAGLYVVAARRGGSVALDDGAWLGDGDRLSVSSGRHRARVSGEARLVSWSDEPAFVSQTERPAAKLFDHVYDY